MGTAAPVVVWDDRCSFCSRCVRLLRVLDRRRRFRYTGSSDHAALAALGITPESADEEMKFVERQRIYGGYDAIARLVSYLPGGGVLSAILSSPLIRAAGRRVYRFVAARRSCRLAIARPLH